MSHDARVQYIRARCAIVFVILVFFLLSSSAMTVTLSYPTPFTWVHIHIVIVFYPEAPKYAALGMAFLSICRKSALTIVQLRQQRYGGLVLPGRILFLWHIHK